MTGRRNRWMCLFVGLTGLSLLAAGCSTNPVTGKRELILISEKQEIAMGLEAAPEFEKQFEGRVADPTLQAYVQEIGQRIAAVSDRNNLQYDYVLVSSKVPNAFALPGGKIFITAGLMSLMQNERELAAVLGHETGHVCAKHNVKGMQRQMGTALLIEVATKVADAGDTGKQVAKVVGSMVNMKYSRDDEYQADELGARYMTRAGYNPWGMVELLTVLLNLHDAEPSRLEEMFQTHPLSTKRIAQVTELIQREYAQHRQTSPDPKAKRFGGMRALLLKKVPLPKK